MQEVQSVPVHGVITAILIIYKEWNPSRVAPTVKNQYQPFQSNFQLQSQLTL